MRKWSLMAIACIIALVLLERVSAHEEIKPDGIYGDVPRTPNCIFSQDGFWFSAQSLGLEQRNGRADYMVRLRVEGLVLKDETSTLLSVFVHDVPSRAWSLSKLQEHVDGIARQLGGMSGVIEFGVRDDK